MMKIESKIRFKQFCDSWKTYKLGNLGSVAMNKRIFREETSEVGEIAFYKIGTFGSEPDSFITREKFEEYKSKYPYPEIGDILISASGSIGRTVEYRGEEAYFQDSNIVWLKHDERLDNSFLKQFYSIVKWQGIEGTTIKRLYNKNILETPIALPSISEQSAIGSFFRTLDDLLASYKDNLANYQSIKATMLSKMFPKAGETVPEIRLDGFEGEWEKYYLGDVFEQVSNYTEPSVENELWSLTVEKGLTPKTDRYKRDFLVKKNDKFKKVDLNEFVFNPMNLTLGALDLNNNEVTISVSGYYVVMKNTDVEKFDNDFLKILLKTTYAIYQYKQFATGTLIEKQRVQFPTFSEIPFYLPSIAEQQAIGTYFTNLDNLIDAYQEKISQLETLKKKLLQDMFI